jgi:hypothetical protein
MTERQVVCPYVHSVQPDGRESWFVNCLNEAGHAGPHRAAVCYDGILEGAWEPLTNFERVGVVLQRKVTA